MAWAYRKESDVAPRALTASVGIKGLPSREDWAVLRKDVLAERRRHEYQRKKKLVEQRAESRRDYMRVYMRSYRRSRD
jgi:translation elongation factor EF-4